MTILRWTTETVGLFAVGLLVGWFAVGLAPGWGGPVIAATIALAVGGRLIFDGALIPLGLGLSVGAVLGVVVYLRDVAVG